MERGSVAAEAGEAGSMLEESRFWTGADRRDHTTRGENSHFRRLLRGGRMTKWKGEVASYAPHAAELVSSTGGVSVGVLFAALLLAAAGPASAADRYWDVNQTAAGSGGTGVWN